MSPQRLMKQSPKILPLILVLAMTIGLFATFLHDPGDRGDMTECGIYSWVDQNELISDFIPVLPAVIAFFAFGCALLLLPSFIPASLLHSPVRQNRPPPFLSF